MGVVTIKIKILNWKRIVQSKKGILYIYLAQNLAEDTGFYKGREVDCNVIVENGKVRIEIDPI